MSNSFKHVITCLIVNNQQSGSISVYQMNQVRLMFKRRLIRRLLGFPLLCIAACVLLCEFLIPLIYIANCNWPTNGDLKDEFRLKTIALSDTHLFGLKRGNFFDKLKREWNMYIGFQFAIHLFQPNSVFFLGDIFDEGLIAGEFLGDFQSVCFT